MFTETAQSPAVHFETVESIKVDDEYPREIPTQYELIKDYIDGIDQLVADRPEQIIATLPSRTNAWSSSEYKEIMSRKIEMYVQECGYQAREVRVYDALPSGKLGLSASEEVERMFLSAERL